MRLHTLPSKPQISPCLLRCHPTPNDPFLNIASHTPASCQLLAALQPTHAGPQMPLFCPCKHHHNTWQLAKASTASLPLRKGGISGCRSLEAVVSSSPVMPPVLAKACCYASATATTTLLCAWSLACISWKPPGCLLFLSCPSPRCSTFMHQPQPPPPCRVHGGLPGWPALSEPPPG
jgi:hypothetical protein